MVRPVVFGRAALRDLDDLYEWIADRAGTAVAKSYTERLRAHCLRLAEFPERGTRRDDLRPGLRTIGYRRQVLFAFAVQADTVVILRILYGGRDLAAAIDLTG